MDGSYFLILVEKETLLSTEKDSKNCVQSTFFLWQGNWNIIIIIHNARLEAKYSKVHPWLSQAIPEGSAACCVEWTDVFILVLIRQGSPLQTKQKPSHKLTAGCANKTQQKWPGRSSTETFILPCFFFVSAAGGKFASFSPMLERQNVVLGDHYWPTLTLVMTSAIGILCVLNRYDSCR